MASMKNHDCTEGLSYVAIESRDEDRVSGVDWVGAAYTLIEMALVSFSLVMVGALFTAYLLV